MSKHPETLKNICYGMRTRLFMVIAASMVLWLLAGCSSLTSGDNSGTTSSDGDNGTFAEIAASFDASVLNLDYTDRDKDPSYDESEATLIMLDGSEIMIDGDGATSEGATLSITAEGTYILSGILDDGQIIVEVSDDNEEKVQLVLNGVTIHNDDGPAIYIMEADKCFITLADGTVNTLTDGGEYELEEDGDEPYATLFSRADLTINGSGTLEVTSSYRHAICSKDDLVITGGTFIIDAVEDGLRGRDRVKIFDGDFTIIAGGDGIKSNKDDDAEKGFVSIDGGTFNIEAGDDGVQGVMYVRIAGGMFNIVAGDDAFHSDVEMLVAGGDVTVEAGDDAFHAETVLTVDNGSVNVTSCYEGYEAEEIYINGGTTYIISSDDAINASAADLSDDDDTDSVDDSAPTEASSVDEVGEAPDILDGDAPSGDMSSGDGTTGRNDGSSGDFSEMERNGGAPDNAFAETGDGVTMGDENCLIQINGGYIVLDAGGDGVDSNGSIEVTGGVLLVNGPASGDDAALDYDLSATITGGTVLMVGSSQMAQNFTGGEQPFVYSNASGSAGDTVALVDSDGNTIVSMVASRRFGMVLASSTSLEEGSEYTIVVGGTIDGSNDDGYVIGGSVTGGTSTTVTASTEASAGYGGLGMNGNPMNAGERGDVQVERRE